MNQGEKKESVKYNKSKKYSDWLDKNMRNYKDKDKIEDKIVIMSTLANEEKINVKTALEANGECEIISTFKVKKNKKTSERKIKGILSMLVEKKKNNSCEQKQVYVKNGTVKIQFFCSEEIKTELGGLLRKGVTR